jgi:Amt family ammonium transporter
LIFGYLIKVTIGFRVSDENEAAGVDTTEHAESGYELGALAGVGSAYTSVRSGAVNHEAVEA